MPAADGMAGPSTAAQEVLHAFAMAQRDQGDALGTAWLMLSVLHML